MALSVDPTLSPLSNFNIEYCLSQYYKSDNPNIGIALIFCNTEELVESKRNIINDNKIRLAKILEEYGFEVRVYDDDSISISKVLKQVSQEDHSQNDCFLAVFISAEDSLSSSKDLYSPDELFKPLLEDECTLKNKPKLIFIDAYRGDERDYGTFCTDSPTDLDEQNIAESYPIPKTADLFIHFSTFMGHINWICDETGSWFIRSLSDALEKYLKEVKDKKRENVDIYDLATFVNRRVASYQTENQNDKSLNGLKFMPIYTSSLTKLFTIKPKPNQL